MARRLIDIMFLLLLSLPCMAQRTVTPVENDDKKPQSPSLHYFDKHGNPLDEPVLFLTELDTIEDKKESVAPLYPILSDLTVGVNFFDGVMAVAKSHYGGADVWANISLWNRFFPTIELGIGAADKQPEDNNFRYKGKPSFYAKIGADYNFMYRKSSDYQLLGGIRLGFSSFDFELKDVSVGSDYWGETHHLDFDSLSSTALYGELSLGMKVKIWRAVSMGWSFRYRFMFDNKPVIIESRNFNNGVVDTNTKKYYGGEFTPWYVPGYGPRTSHIGFTFSVSYTFNLWNRGDSGK